MTNSERAVNKFKEGYNCAQSVLFSLSRYTDIDEDLSLRLATGFGAGMGRTQHVCGAVSGGLLAINALYGRGEKELKEKQDDVYLKVQHLIGEFEKRKKTIICRELLDGCDLLTPRGQSRFSSENMIEMCHSYVRSVVEIVEEIMEEK